MKRSITILQNIQKELQKIKQGVLPSSLNKEPISSSTIIQGPFFKYIPFPIQKYILEHNWKRREKIQQVFSLKNSEKRVQFTMYVHTDQTSDPISDAFAIFSFLLERVPDKNTVKNEYELYYYDTPFLKEFPKEGELIDEIHANSGFTVKSSSVPIYVFRNEESRRVCVHEILHALGFDGTHHETGRGPVETPTECLNLLSPIQGQHLCDKQDGVRIYEAFTETQATILNVLLQNPRSAKTLKKQLLLEKKHVLRKTEEIQNHYGVSDNNYRGYKQGVSKTISYFLFRGFLMNEMDRFIQNSLLVPQSTDYVKIIEEGIKKRGQGSNKTQKKKRGYGSKRKTLKMNYST